MIYSKILNQILQTDLNGNGYCKHCNDQTETELTNRIDDQFTESIISICKQCGKIKIHTALEKINADSEKIQKKIFSLFDEPIRLNEHQILVFDESLEPATEPMDACLEYNIYNFENNGAWGEVEIDELEPIDGGFFEYCTSDYQTFTDFNRSFLLFLELVNDLKDSNIEIDTTLVVGLQAFESHTI